jgi:hypothetical protein
MGPGFVARKFLVARPVDQSRMSFRYSARSSTSLRCFLIAMYVTHDKARYHA